MDTITKIQEDLQTNLPTLKWEDQGIGPYEFWGQKGTDVQWALGWEEDELHLRMELETYDVIEVILQEFFELSFEKELDDEWITLYPHILSILFSYSTRELSIVYNWQDYPALDPILSGN